jgi:hypothetical protein
MGIEPNVGNVIPAVRTITETRKNVRKGKTTMYVYVFDGANGVPSLNGTTGRQEKCFSTFTVRVESFAVAFTKTVKRNPNESMDRSIGPWYP